MLICINSWALVFACGAATFIYGEEGTGRYVVELVQSAASRYEARCTSVNVSLVDRMFVDWLCLVRQ